MRIHNLNFKNIGPFHEANIEFISEDDNVLKPPIIIITGENGTGKSIILDAIRTLCLGEHTSIERDITSSDTFSIEAEVSLTDDKTLNISSEKKNQKNYPITNSFDFNFLFQSTSYKNALKNDFIVNYWTSKLSNDSFKIQNIEIPNTNDYLIKSLSGIHFNVEVTKTITYFDYLSGGTNGNEGHIGKKMSALIKKVIDLSINEGHLSHISRTLLQPIIKIGNNEVSLDKLSSGNLYLIQRLTHLLKQMYGVCMTHNIPIDEIQNVQGLLLIDEAENHLHPKWQKVFIKNILDLFPHLQIIVTTHSPLIVSSVENARVYVCTSENNVSTITEETDYYSNLPIEEILQSPLFNTNSFNTEISELLTNRKIAIKSNNLTEVERIEDLLLKLNPEYFNYLKIDKLLKEISK